MGLALLREQVLWALCVYVEAVSVLPQLRMMQKAKVLRPEPGLKLRTAHRDTVAAEYCCEEFLNYN